jgi:hypothetical protein
MAGTHIDGGKKQKKTAGKKATKNVVPDRNLFAVPPEMPGQTVEELRARARRLGLTGYYRLRRADLLERLQEGDRLSRV